MYLKIWLYKGWKNSEFQCYSCRNAWIPLESAGIHWIPVQFQWNPVESGRIQAFLQESEGHQKVLSVWFTPSTRSSLKSNISLKSSSIEQLPLNVCAESTTKYTQMKLFKHHTLTLLIMFVVNHPCLSAPPLSMLALTDCCQIEVIVHLPPIRWKVIIWESEGKGLGMFVRCEFYYGEFILQEHPVIPNRIIHATCWHIHRPL